MGTPYDFDHAVSYIVEHSSHAAMGHLIGLCV